MADDTNNGIVDPLNNTVVAPTATGTPANDPDAQSGTEVDVAKLQESNKRLFERAKKAEAEAKALKQGNNPAPVVASVQQTSPASVDVDERILKSQGMNPELLQQLKDIAKLRGVNLIDAQSDPLFVATKEKFEKDEKSKRASVGASRGSTGVQVQKDLNTPGLTREDHMKLVKNR